MSGGVERPVRWLNALRSISTHDHHQEHGDRGRGNRLVLAVAVRVVLVGRPAGGADAHEPTTFEPASVSEWKPSERMLMAPLV